LAFAGLAGLSLYFSLTGGIGLDWRLDGKSALAGPSVL